jgi:hypothetical protein
VCNIQWIFKMHGATIKIVTQLFQEIEHRFFQFVATVSASDMWGSNCIYISKISKIGRYGRIVSSHRTERSEVSGTTFQLWSTLLHATLSLNLALQCRVQKSFLAHVITIWHINVGYEEVYVAKSYSVCGQVLKCFSRPASFIFTQSREVHKMFVFYNVMFKLIIII